VVRKIHGSRHPHQFRRTEQQPNFSRPVRRRLKRRWRLYRKVLQAEYGSNEAIEAVRRWRALQKRTTEDIANERQANLKKIMVVTAENMKDNPKAAWTCVKNIAGWAPRSNVGFQLLKDATTGELKVDTDGVLGVWVDHYEDLLRDHTGHSKNGKHWEFAFPGDCSQEWQDEMETLNVPFTESQLKRALQRTKCGKAPGLDGIPAEVYKILSGTTGQSPMADALLTLAKSIFLSGCIPADWETNLIVPIFKKGDETDTNNYRGVALMCTALKVICVMLHWQISNISWRD
jgi:hypothetical protein